MQIVLEWHRTDNLHEDRTCKRNRTRLAGDTLAEVMLGGEKAPAERVTVGQTE